MRIRSAVSVYHQTDDLFICLPHPVFAQPADPADRGFHIFHDDPGSRACTCAHGAAVGRERADPGFLVDGYQV